LGGGWYLRGVHPKKYTCLPKKDASCFNSFKMAKELLTCVH